MRDIAACQIRRERRLLRQHLHHRLLQHRRQAARCRDHIEIGKQRRERLLLRGRGLGRKRHCDPLQRRQGIAGRRHRDLRRVRDRVDGGGRVWSRGDRRIRRDTNWIVCRRRTGILRHHRKPHRAIGCLRYRQLQILPRRQRHLRHHVDRQPGDRDLHQVFGNLEHLRVDHRAGLQHNAGGGAAGGLRGNDGKVWVDGQRHGPNASARRVNLSLT